MGIELGRRGAPDLEDVATLTYSALKAAVLAGANTVVLEHLLDAYKACAGRADAGSSDLGDAVAFTIKALQASGDGACNEALVDSLLDALREIERDGSAFI